MIRKSSVALAAFLFFALSCLPATQQLHIVQKPAKHASGKLDIAIYYESLCPDSIRFVIQQLPRAYASYRESINIKFVPFGKVKVTTNPDGTYNLQCQHGPIECEGNRMQSCALSFISDPDKQAQFVPCVMNGTDPRVHGPKCAQDIGLNYGDVEECYASDEGLELQLQAKADTDAAQNPLDFVPTIVYNNVFDKGLSDDSRNDFSSVISRQLALS